MTYVLPQVQVFQEFRVIPTEVVRNLNAFVFGANYALFRYNVEAEKALIGLGAYDFTADTVYDYPSQPAASIVDTDYAKLYFENVWAQYFEQLADEETPIVMVGANELNKLRLEDGCNGCHEI